MQNGFTNFTSVYEKYDATVSFKAHIDFTDRKSCFNSKYQHRGNYREDSKLY